MGWGVTYPSPKGWEPEDERLECEAKGCTNRIEEGEDVACQHAGCTREALCCGCSFPCADCELWFCKEHIVEHKLPNHFADYRCYGCDRKRQAKEAA